MAGRQSAWRFNTFVGSHRTLQPLSQLAIVAQCVPPIKHPEHQPSLSADDPAKRANTMYLGFVSKHQLRDEDAQSAKLLTANMALSCVAVMGRCKTLTGMCAK